MPWKPSSKNIASSTAFLNLACPSSPDVFGAGVEQVSSKVLVSEVLNAIQPNHLILVLNILFPLHATDLINPALFRLAICHAPV